MSDHRDDQIEYRIEKAQEAIADANLLANNSAWNACMNRLYYACFYSTSALLLKHGIPVKTHSGLKTQFNLHFVKTGRVSKELGKLYAELMNWREKSDYCDMFDFTQEKVKPLIMPVEEFVNTLTGMIESNKKSNL